MDNGRRNAVVTPEGPRWRSTVCQPARPKLHLRNAAKFSFETQRMPVMQARCNKIMGIIWEFRGLSCIIYIYMWISWTIVFCWDNWNWKPWMCMAFHMNFVGVSGDRNPNRSPIHWKSLIIGHFRGYPSDKLRDDNVSNKLWNFQHQTIWLVVKPPLWKILVNWDD